MLIDNFPLFEVESKKPLAYPYKPGLFVNFTKAKHFSTSTALIVKIVSFLLEPFFIIMDRNNVEFYRFLREIRWAGHPYYKETRGEIALRFT